MACMGDYEIEFPRKLYRESKMLILNDIPDNRLMYLYIGLFS